MAFSLLLAWLSLGLARSNAQEPSYPIYATPPSAGELLPPPISPPGMAPASAPVAPVEFIVPTGQGPQEQKEKEPAPSLIYPRVEKGGAGQPSQRYKKGEEEVGFAVTTELPGPKRLFQRESETQLFERLRQEYNRPGAAKVYFPEEPPLSREKRPMRMAWKPRTAVVEPGYVYHGRLLFEQENFERYGWELGVLQPGISVVGYYYDLAMLPYHIWSRPFDQYEVSSGKCLPGDPVPLLLYPEGFSITGLAGMAGTYMAGPFIFP